MNSSVPQKIELRPVEESDFPTLAAWLAEPHVRRFYQKTPVTLEEVALEYGPRTFWEGGVKMVLLGMKRPSGGSSKVAASRERR